MSLDPKDMIEHIFKKNPVEEVEEIIKETFKKTNERNHKMMSDFLLYGDDYKGIVKYSSGKEIEGDGYERWEDGRLVIYTAEKEMPVDHIAMARGFSDGDKIIWVDTLEEGSAIYKEYHSQMQVNEDIKTHEDKLKNQSQTGEQNMNISEVKENLQSISNMVEDAEQNKSIINKLTDILACYPSELVEIVEKMRIETMEDSNVDNSVDKIPTLDVIKDIIKKAYQQLENDALILDGDPKLYVDDYGDEATITIEKDDYYPDYEELADHVHEDMVIDQESAKEELEKEEVTEEEINEGMGTNETEVDMVSTTSTEGAEVNDID